MEQQEIESLVQYVTEKIVQKLNLSTRSEKHLLFVDQAVADYPKEVIEPLKEEFQLIVPYEIEKSEAVGLLVKRLSFQQMSALSQLQVVDYTTKLCVRCLLNGLPVWVLSYEVEPKLLRKEASYPLWKKVSEIYEQVQRLGIVSIKNTYELTEKIQCYQSKKQKSTQGKKEFLTEKKLKEQLTKGRSFQDILAENQLTPLARDYYLQWKLNRKSE
ncbi:MAG: hypothetical protein LBM95_07210 [Lactobacillales bacterium]|jgi:ethanolamine utilization protein|nr:hypothetical protein [Lactobacillales bacterium]